MKKKMLSLVLVGMFALGAVACGGGDDTTDTTDTATTGTATTAPTEATS